MKPFLVATIACALASPAFADSKSEAKAHMEAAAAAYKAGRFEDTLAELNKAYAKDPKPELHYSIGQVYMKLDRCDDATKSYQAFLASKPSRDRADLAEQAIATCKARKAKPGTTSTSTGPTTSTSKPGTTSTSKPGTTSTGMTSTGTTTSTSTPGTTSISKPGTTSTSTGTTSTTTAASTSTTPSTSTTVPTSTSTSPTETANAETSMPAGEPRAEIEERPAWYADKLGLGLTGGGLVVTGLGLFLYSSARGKIDDAENAATYAESQELYDDAKSQRTLSMVFVVGGLAVTGVGIWRLVSKRNSERSGVAIVPSTGGGLVTYSGGF
jgi:tetratricopeptide (TPR) repeat protein